MTLYGGSNFKWLKRDKEEAIIEREESQPKPCSYCASQGMMNWTKYVSYSSFLLQHAWKRISSGWARNSSKALQQHNSVFVQGPW